MAFLSEAAVEQALLDQLRALNYSIELEEDIGPDADASKSKRPERESHDEVVLKNRFEDAVARRVKLPEFFACGAPDLPSCSAHCSERPPYLESAF